MEGALPTSPAEWDALPWVWSGDDTHSSYTYNPGRGGTFTFRVQWFDRLMNLGPLGGPVTCAVTG